MRNREVGFLRSLGVEKICICCTYVLIPDHVNGGAIDGNMRQDRFVAGLRNIGIVLRPGGASVGRTPIENVSITITASLVPPHDVKIVAIVGNRRAFGVCSTSIENCLAGPCVPAIRRLEYLPTASFNASGSGFAQGRLPMPDWGEILKISKSQLHLPPVPAEIPIPIR